MLSNFFLATLEKTASLWAFIDPQLQAPFAVGLGAILGALSRYYLTIRLTQWLGTDFPYGTFIINLSGTLLMGFFIPFTFTQLVSLELQRFITIGFLGSYTTFSTYILDTSILLRSGSRGKAIFYWTGSVVLGEICLEIGITLAKMIR